MNKFFQGGLCNHCVRAGGTYWAQMNVGSFQKWLGKEFVRANLN
jgi:hypothetical protein